MIIKRSWVRRNRKYDVLSTTEPQYFGYQGWFLFWIIPLYIVRVRIP